MVKCFFTIMLQMAIIFYKFKPIVESEVPVFRGDAGLNAVRLICSFVMHLYTYPEIRRGQQMIQFALYNTHKFPQRSAFWPLILASLKMFGALASEYGNIFNILRDQTYGQVIGGYVTMSIIAKIETIMALTLTQCDIGGDYSNNPIMYRRKQNIFGDIYLVKKWIKHYQMNPLQWIVMLTFLLFNRILRFVYVVLYFYFLPFIILLFVEGSDDPTLISVSEVLEASK